MGQFYYHGPRTTDNGPHVMRERQRKGFNKKRCFAKRNLDFHYEGAYHANGSQGRGPTNL